MKGTYPHDIEVYDLYYNLQQGIRIVITKGYNLQ